MLPIVDPWLEVTHAYDATIVSYGAEWMIRSRQKTRLRALLFAATRSLLYRRLIGARRIDDLTLADLPVAHKADLMRDFDDWVADPAIRLDDLRRFTADPANQAEPFLGRYMVWESSGSNGVPALFVQDAHAMAVYDALEWARRPVFRAVAGAGGVHGAGPAVFVGATDGAFASVVSIERLRRLNPMIGASLHCLSFMRPKAEWMAELERLDPASIATYPSVALALAEERRAGRLSISPAEVWTGGETLEPGVRRHIEETFGCRVVNSYGASEFLTIGCECAHGRLHVNEDWVLLESVDRHGRPVAPGTTGQTVLLTNLANHVQPVIRYDLGDRVTFVPGRCTCGSILPVIQVEGRCDDALHLGDDGVTVTPLALTTVLEDAGLFEFQLVQKGPRALELRVCGSGAGFDRVADKAVGDLAHFLVAQGAGAIRIVRRRTGTLPLTRSGKLCRVRKRGPTLAALAG